MNWQSFSKHYYSFTDLQLAMDLSCLDMDDAWMTSMAPAIENAVLEMRALEEGAIANPDEQRMVGHYWLRAPELAPDEQLAQAIRDDLAHVLALSEKVLSGSCLTPGGKPFSQLLLVGIGGSALGPQFVSAALAETGCLPISFLDNTDPDGIKRVLDAIGEDLGQTLVMVISKSGGTAETRNGMLEVRARFAAAGHNFAGQAVAVTGMGSALETLAKEEGWLDILHMYDWIGGRTSEFSAVGLLPAALQGIDIRGMLAGARLMDEATRQADPRKNPAMLLALAWYKAGNGRGERNMVVLPYKDRLQLFSRYLQQLVMESLGKDVDRRGKTVHQGITVYGNKGSTDQHAYVQQLRDGPADFFATFIEVLNDGVTEPVEVKPGVYSGDYLYGFLRGTRRALSDTGRASLVLTLDALNANSLGGVVALYERAVGLYASLIDVNAYHQPGVEAGKKAAEEILSLQLRLMQALSEAGEPVSVTELASRLGAQDRAEEVFYLLRRLAANGRINLAEAPGGSGEPLASAL